ncbi:MAG: ABC transporter ATP-binding protein [Bacteroidia bacterium]|nr:ABC transporter ATP-binding protein [Bacteroidia bacterium]
MRELSSLNKYFIRYKNHFLGGLLFVTISNLFGIFPAQLTRNALDVVAANIDSYRLFNGFDARESVYNDLMFNILLFGVLVLSMALMKGVFMFLMRQTIIVMSRHIEYDMKNAIYAHYQRLGLDFYNRNSTGDLMNRISEDVGRVRMYVGPAIMYSINLLVMFILVIWAMFSVNPRLAAYVLIPLPVMTYLVYFVHDRINRKSEKVQEQLSTLSTFIQETFSGIRLIKAYAREADYEHFYKVQSDRYRSLSMDLVRVNAFFIPTMLLLVGMSTLLTVYIGSLEVMAGRLTVGNIAEFVIYVNMLTWPVASLGWVVTIIQRAAASQQRINEFLNEEPGIISGDVLCTSLKGDIVFDQVDVSYEENRTPALQNISFKLSAGSSLGIIGKTGSGKTSLVNVLLRLLHPVKGTVSIDGLPVDRYNIDSLRKRIGYVPQDVFLFSDTIEENIAFGLEHGAEGDRVAEAARLAVVYDAILSFPDGFKTMLGERGITLSGGQKQRISIARAIVRNPDILIFDDCLSAVDTITEEQIIGNLTKLMQGKTTILVSHRVATVKSCHHILVLDEGKVVEEGDHDFLIRQNGLYRHLYDKQLMEESESPPEAIEKK